MDSNLEYVNTNRINVAVILSAYSGHRYIKEQVDSILNQEYNTDKYTITLYIRDDSKTKDAQMLEYFNSLRKDGRIVFLNNNPENVGVKKSFFELLKYVQSDFYFFSDQDDIWEKNKIAVFLKRYESLDDRTPLLIYSNLLLIDYNNRSLESTMKDTVGKNRGADNFVNRLLDDAITGASMAINRSLRDTIISDKNYFDEIVMHDSYLGIVASLTGKIVYIDEVLTRYRQHNNNVIGVKLKKYGRLNPLKYIMRYKWVNDHYKQAIVAIKCLKNNKQAILPENQPVVDALVTLTNLKRFNLHNYYLLVHATSGITDKIIVSYQWLVGIRSDEPKN